MTPLSPRQHRAKADRRGYTLLTGCATAIAVAAAALLANRAPPRDATTLCLPGKLAKHTLIIVDRTDPWTDTQASLLAAALKSIERGIELNQRLSLISFDGAPDRPPAPLFDRCRPAKPAEAHAAIENPALVGKRFEAEFAAPLHANLATVLQPSRASETHLVAFLANVAAHLKFDDTAQQVRIVLFSDLAENTPDISVYGKSRGLFATAFPAHFQAVLRDRLAGIRLDLYVLPPPRDPPGLRQRIKQTWSEALTAAGVSFSWTEL